MRGAAATAARRRPRAGSSLAARAALVAALLGAGACAGERTPAAIALAPACEVGRDPAGAATLDDLLRRSPRAPTLRPLTPGSTNFGFSRDTFWLRCRLPEVAGHPEGGPAAGWILELTRTPEEAELFTVEDGVPRRQVSGTTLPFSARPVPAPRISFPLTPSPGLHEVFVRLRSNDTIVLDPHLWGSTAFAAKELRARLVVGLYFGLLLAMILYNLVLAGWTGERTYLRYVAFQGAMLLYQACAEKYSFELLWPEHPRWDAALGMAAGAAAVVAGMWLAQGFLQTRRHLPRFHRAIGGLGAGAVALELALFATGSPLIRTVLALYVVGAIVVVAAAAAAAVVARVSHAWAFLVAWAFLLAGTALAIAGSIGLLESVAWHDAMMLGSALEAILMALALAARINTLRLEREQAQQRLLALERAQSIDLERQVGERTRSLTAALDSLRAAQDALVRQERLAILGRMIAGVAHEVGNPLNFSIGGAAELARWLDELPAALNDRTGPASGSDPRRLLEQARASLRLVDSGNERIRRIVDSLRGYARPAASAGEGASVPGVLASTLALAGEALRRAHVEVRQSMEPTLPALRCGPGELGQIFINLILNACQAMAEGGRLTVDATAYARGVEVVFTDTGPGVPRELRERVFEPFFTTRGPEGGSGLGLYVCREIVARNGGEIRLDDAPGGARVILLLPIGAPHSVNALPMRLESPSSCGT
ncbi:MAG TPA: 7TM diverse intracellular signaling domain-containing protein [Polyangia bacterium]|nr:7TM diverse intracellular signaling domain-containing protein [Polyangia bacterium]